MNTLKSKVKQKNSQYFDIADLAYIPEREVNEDEFVRDPDLSEIDFHTYESEVQELFDILLD